MGTPRYLKDRAPRGEQRARVETCAHQLDPLASHKARVERGQAGAVQIGLHGRLFNVKQVTNRISTTICMEHRLGVIQSVQATG